MNPSELDNFKKLIFDSDWVSVKSDTPLEIIENDDRMWNDVAVAKGMIGGVVIDSFGEYIDGCSDIIKIKKEPYYTLIKHTILNKYLVTDIKVDDGYKTQMKNKLYLIQHHLYHTKNEVLGEVVNIIEEYLSHNNTAVSKQILEWLNKQYKKN
jgi:hypothetical protein